MEKTPNFRGCSPKLEQWLDKDTFVIFFDGWKDRDVDTTNTLYIEVQTDEDNRIVIGENIVDFNFEYLGTNYYRVGDEIRDEIIGMDETIAKEITEYALERMKTY